MSGKLHQFIREIRPDDLPEQVLDRSTECLLDLIAVAVAGTETKLSRIIRDYAADYCDSTRNSARIIGDGRGSGLAAAAMAGAATIDSMDAHDGHNLTKGHAGAAGLPALLAFADSGGPMSGPELLTQLVIAYEVGTRAGIALHSTAADYHSSGAWNSLACAAVGARALGLDDDQTAEALGIAEYHGPRSQIMRCIDYPTMVKDGSAWGAMSGVSAALLASKGFTGAPALTSISAQSAQLWSDLGQRWYIMEQYFKRFPICRWATAAVDAAVSLAESGGFRSEDVSAVEVATFDPATRLQETPPSTTEEAQYHLRFNVAAALRHGDVAPSHVVGSALTDPEVLRIAEAVSVREQPAFTERFPGERLAVVAITLRDGNRLASAPTSPRGEFDAPLSREELRAKARRYLTPVVGEDRAGALESLVPQLRHSDDSTALLDAVLVAA